MHNQFNSILLIDDKVADNRYNQIILQRMNIINKIEIAENGEEALSILANTTESHSKLIFLDLNMPRMTGWEFLEAYQQSEACKKNKHVIIILSTSMNPEDRAKANTIPCVAEFHSKPLTPEMFKEILQKYFPDDEAI